MELDQLSTIMESDDMIETLPSSDYTSTEQQPSSKQLYTQLYTGGGGDIYSKLEEDDPWPSENVALGTLITLCVVCILIIWTTLGILPLQVLHRR